MHRQWANRRRSYSCGWKQHSGQRIKRKLDQCRNRNGYIDHSSKRGIGHLTEATADCKHGILTGVYILLAISKASWSCGIWNGKLILASQ